MSLDAVEEARFLEVSVPGAGMAVGDFFHHEFGTGNDYGY
jgi:hypothetical protein